MTMGLKLLPWLLFSPAVLATQLTYTPVNPNFGGNPLNGSYLMSNASAQNDHESGSGFEPPSDLERLTASLESRLINQLLNDTADGNTGFLNTDDFNIAVTNIDGILELSIFEIATGEQTFIEVGGVFN